MECIIGVGVAIVSNLAEYTVVYARRLCHYTSDVDNLRAQVQQLNAERQKLQGRVDEASGQGDDIHDGVQHWLTSARDISQKAEDFLINNRDRASINCCSVQIPNLVSRRKLSREARQMVEKLQGEIQAAQRFDAVASRPALQTFIAMRGDYEDFGSRKMTLEVIMKALKDPNVSRIGIYGIGGIGKTVLAKEVARQAVEAKLFTEVAMTTVSRTPDFSGMQREIAEKIRLDFKGSESIPERAHRLQCRLKEQKSILIILDDIWEELDLIEVGIHLENEGCKILMTSRSQRVLGSMGIKPNFSVAVLPAEEAMNFFKTIVGDIIKQSNFGRLATDVVKECGGLPLAIRTVAYALKDYPYLFTWETALDQLQNSAPTDIDGMLTKVYPSIRWSYDFLESDDEKSMLLLCSLFGEDRNIRVEDLMMCCVGLGMFADHPPLTRYVRMRVESLIIRLKARCLLLDGDRGDGVKMHDIIRDVALFIASKKGGMYSVILKKEDCWSLNMEKLRDSKVLSVLPYSEFNQLPQRLECSELELFLLLSGQGSRIPIPISFFDDCKDRLKSLLFDRANLVTIPPSFHSLQNLQTLCLRDCVLEDVTFIGDLKTLQILDLSKSTIKQLPAKVAQLSRLRLLNLEGCTDLKLIEPNVISSLKQLEELYISEYFDKWEVGEVDVSRRSNVNLAEIENLQQLTSLSLRVPDAKAFPKDFKFSEKLERYRIYIGGSWNSWYPTGISRSLGLTLCERSQLTALGLESLMKRSEFLSLDQLIDVKNFVYDLDCEGFCDLKHLNLRNSDGVQYIVNCVDQQIHPYKAFPVLETLSLGGLRNLEMICHGKLPEDSFKNLRKITVWSCDKLKNVFPLSIFKRLNSIRVSHCEMMEEIVGHVRSEDDGAVEFPELRSLTLVNLPNMVKFMSWSEAEAAGGSSSVESPDPLFGEKVVLPSLEDLTLKKLGVKMLWADQLASTSYMPNLSSLCIKDCGNLKYVSSFAMAKSFPIKLEKLKVSRCSVLEEVLVITDLQGEDDGSLEKISLPQLKSLKLNDLPNLKRFCKHPDELETLVTSKELTGEGSEHEEVEFGIEEPLFSEMVELPSLEDLTLKKLGVKMLWADQLASTSHMPNLSSLSVGSCCNLKYVSSYATAKSCLIKLKKLGVYACSVLEEVLAITDLQGQDDGSLEKISLPQLKSLRLGLLPNLKRFCKRRDELKTLVTSTELTGEGSEHEEVEFSTEEPFFSEMVELPSLEDLILNLGVKMLWANQLASTSYMPNLSSLCIRGCGNLKYLPSFAMAKSYLIKLKELQVCGCSVLEEVLAITDLQGQDDGSLEKISLPQLKSLRLGFLPNLKRFCKCHDELKTLVTSTELTGDGSEHEEVEFGAEEPFFSEMVEFPSLEVLTLRELGVKMLWADQLASTSYMPNLSSLFVRNCGNLKYVSSFATAKSCLIKLETLCVDTCSVLEEVLVTTDLQEQDDGSLEKISLSQLKSLTLHNLPYLKRFCKNPHELKKLETNSTSTEITVDRTELEEMEFNAKESLFNEMLEFPGLETLDLYGLNAVESVCHLQTTCYMVNLTSLSVGNCNSLKYLFSLAVAERLVKLKNLQVGNCEVMEYIVVTKKLGEEGRSGNKMRLDNVPKLRHLFGEPENDHPVGGALQPVKTLFVSFQNLTILEVSFCHRLTYLLASSMATSLVQLKQMRVTDCNRMTEIIIDYREGEITEGEHDREFVFPQLEILVLRHLPNLGSFFSGNNVMRFPKLEKLFVSHCPEMRSFSYGIIISSSMLNTIITEINSEWWWRSTNMLIKNAKAVREHWDGDVNTTVRQLWEDDSNLALQQLFAETELEF